MYATIPVLPATAAKWRQVARFTGPGILVAVGYMDPGNWITSITGGATYGYLLLFVILTSSLAAMLLQYLSLKLGVATGKDLARNMRDHTSRRVGIALWVVAELAIMATDIAEIIGAAIALHLLFSWPLLLGVLVTILDVFLLLALLKLGWRRIEALVAALVATIMVVFVYQTITAGPDPAAVLAGFAPSPRLAEPGPLALALGIIGATVMPHNLYLHSGLVQTRAYDRHDDEAKARAIKLAAIDSNVQLTLAFFVNAMLLVVGAAVFFGHGDEVGTFTAIYQGLQDHQLAGAIASPVLATLFAVALLASGQNSTITGTLAGQIVMEGFLKIQLPLWLRRLVTRGLAVLPVLVVTIWCGGDEHTLDVLLINSQIFLALALPFAVIPLMLLTGSKQVMGVFSNGRVTAAAGWLIAVVLTLLNVMLIWQTGQEIWGS